MFGLLAELGQQALVDCVSQFDFLFSAETFFEFDK